VVVRLVGKAEAKGEIPKKWDLEADVVVGADGVHSRVRLTLAKPLPRQDLCLTYSANLPGQVKLPITLKFFKGVEGYAWIFPRRHETSVASPWKTAT
jgi:flavin-dependent dehydrogenase